MKPQRMFTEVPDRTRNISHERFAPEVCLSWMECFDAVVAAAVRRLDALFKNHGNRFGERERDETAWSSEIEGAGGEIAVAKCTGRYWGGAGTFRGADVLGGGWQVRQTTLATGCLRIYEHDPDHKAFVLVTGQMPLYTVRGWLYASEGKRLEYRRDPHGKGRPCYFVPQGHPLRRIHTVPDGTVTDDELPEPR